MKFTLRSAIALATVAAAFVLPATASAINVSGNGNFGYLEAGQSATADFTFTRQGSSEKISGFVLTGSAFSIVTDANTTCNLSATGDHNAKSFPAGGSCKVRIQFTAPGLTAGDRLDASGSLKVLSNWDNFLADYDAKANFTGFGVLRGVAGQPGPVGPQGPGCVVRLPEQSPPAGSEGVEGVEGPTGDITLLVNETPEGDGQADENLEGFESCPIGPQGPQGLKGEKGDKGDTGAQGVQGIQGEAGPTGAAAPQSAAVVVAKYISVRTSCTVVKNKAKVRVATCIVKLPARSPKSKYTLLVGGTGIKSGTVKAGTKQFKITKALPKSVAGFVTVRLKTA